MLFFWTFELLNSVFTCVHVSKKIRKCGLKQKQAMWRCVKSCMCVNVVKISLRRGFVEVTLGVLNHISPNAVHRPELFRFVLIEQILVPRLLSAVNTDLKLSILTFFKLLCEKLVQPRFRCSITQLQRATLRALVCILWTHFKQSLWQLNGNFTPTFRNFQ